MKDGFCGCGGGEGGATGWGGGYLEDKSFFLVFGRNLVPIFFFGS